MDTLRLAMTDAMPLFQNVLMSTAPVPCGLLDAVFHWQDVHHNSSWEGLFFFFYLEEKFKSVKEATHLFKTVSRLQYMLDAIDLLRSSAYSNCTCNHPDFYLQTLRSSLWCLEREQGQGKHLMVSGKYLGHQVFGEGKSWAESMLLWMANFHSWYHTCRHKETVPGSKMNGAHGPKWHWLSSVNWKRWRGALRVHGGSPFTWLIQISQVWVCSGGAAWIYVQYSSLKSCQTSSESLFLPWVCTKPGLFWSQPWGA